MKPNNPNDSEIIVILYHDEERYLAHSPELNLLGYGKTEEEAKADFDKAINTFIEFHNHYGNLKSVLKKLGFKQYDHTTVAPDCIQIPKSALRQSHTGSFTLNHYNLQPA